MKSTVFQRDSLQCARRASLLCHLEAVEGGLCVLPWSSLQILVLCTSSRYITGQTIIKIHTLLTSHIKCWIKTCTNRMKHTGFLWPALPRPVQNGSSEGRQTFRKGGMSYEACREGRILCNQVGRALINDFWGLPSWPIPPPSQGFPNLKENLFIGKSGLQWKRTLVWVLFHSMLRSNPIQYVTQHSMTKSISPKLYCCGNGTFWRSTVSYQNSLI